MILFIGVILTILNYMSALSIQFIQFTTSIFDIIQDLICVHILSWLCSHVGSFKHHWSVSALLCLLLGFTGLYIFNYGSDSFAPVLEWLQTGFAQVIHLKVWKPPVTGILMWRQCRICFSSCIFNVPPAL